MGRTKKLGKIEKLKNVKQINVEKKNGKKMPTVKNLVLHKDMIRYLKHCDSGGDEKKVSFLETSFKASSETLGAVQGHVNNFVTMILNDLYDAYPNKNIISEKDLQEIIRKKGIELLYYDYDDLERPSESEMNDNNDIRRSINVVGGSSSSNNNNTRRNNNISNNNDDRQPRHKGGYRNFLANRRNKNRMVIRRRKTDINKLLLM